MLTRQSKIGFAAVFAALIPALLLSGCAKKSPAIGTWSDPNKVFTMTLEDGGTGTASANLPMMGTQSAKLKWKEEEGKVTLEPAEGEKPNPMLNNLSMTVGEDGKTMSVSMMNRTVSLTKQETAAK
jgi:hypothetical protein